MTYYYDDLIPQIRVRLNLPPSDPTFPAAFKTASLPVDDLIASVIEESAREVVAACHAAAYPEPKTLPGRPDWRSDFDCAVRLPDDFLHLVAFRMSGWRRNVTRLILPDEEEYACLSSPFRFIRGTPESPRCYLLDEAGGAKLIACSSERREEDMVVGLYVPVPVATGYAHQRHIDFPALLADRIIETAAGKARDILSF